MFPDPSLPCSFISTKESRPLGPCIYRPGSSLSRFQRKVELRSGSVVSTLLVLIRRDPSQAFGLVRGIRGKRARSVSSLPLGSPLGQSGTPIRLACDVIASAALDNDADVDPRPPQQPRQGMHVLWMASKFYSKTQSGPGHARIRGQNTGPEYGWTPASRCGIGAENVSPSWAGSKLIGSVGSRYKLP